MFTSRRESGKAIITIPLLNSALVEQCDYFAIPIIILKS